MVVTTQPFGLAMPHVRERLLEEFGNVKFNETGGRLNGQELARFVTDADYIIAGTETYTIATLDNAPNLKAIFRVGIGLDGLPLNFLAKRGVQVYFTPDAPAPAVADLAVCQVLNCLRGTFLSDRQIALGRWERSLGIRVAEATIGVLGVGRIGSRVITRLHGFGTPTILACDKLINNDIDRAYKVTWVGLDELLERSDVVTIHLPLNKSTKGLLDRSKLLKMRAEASVVNTSRGGIVVEEDLHEILMERSIKSACIDVFEAEPYRGPLSQNPFAFLSAHLGSMTNDCRGRMEQEAVDDLLRVASREIGLRMVPDSEYENSLL